ncbi:Uncharacterised protein [Serratia fonticola]|uniref:Uncharacterized protein n=1 Tax=Serratia fonticola TaxID=47917 RepID=A0A4U9TXR9_SERFO|nr:Uncharacterised protein [Serratia fonticola]
MLAEEHENWLKDKVDAAFARLHEGEAVYLTQRQAEERMSDFKTKVRRNTQPNKDYYAHRMGTTLRCKIGNAF